MKQRVDLIVHSARQLLTLGPFGEVGDSSAISAPSRPRRGEAMNELGLIEDGAVAVSHGLVALVGTTEEVLAQTEADEMIDASNRVVMPGFVDSHTHLVFAGSREDEFESRLRGATYMEIMAAGGGIMSTVRATRAAALPHLTAQSRERLDRMLAYGTTTAEAKSGYGLNVDDELKMLKAIRQLDATHPIDLVPTFLGAHAVPVEFRGRADEYVEVVINEMLPLAERELRKDAPGASALSVPFFCDVFCEEGVFSVNHSRSILERARELGFGLKVHADEFKPLGGTGLAVELGAVSADHLVCTPVDEIEALAGSDTIAVSLPGTPFGLGHHEYTPARQIIEAGGALALATDLNPGTCYCESMQFIIALACRHMRLTPAEAITAATLNAAHAIGLGDKVGSLETGKEADILVLDIPNYRHLAYHFGVNLVERVIKSGQILYRNKWQVN
jgi:imidazolonepropionase